MSEIWKTIDEFPNYEVSNLGNVRSKTHIDSLNRVHYSHLLKTHLDGRGNYLEVNLCRKGEHRTVNVHRLVAIAFVDNPNSYKEVNHKDENKTNNKASNLEWCTRKYNNNYGSKKYSTRGIKNPQCKITLETVMFIKKNHVSCGGKIRNKDLAKMFNLSATHVSSIAHGRRWTYAIPD